MLRVMLRLLLFLLLEGHGVAVDVWRDAAVQSAHVGARVHAGRAVAVCGCGVDRQGDYKEEAVCSEARADVGTLDRTDIIMHLPFGRSGEKTAYNSIPPSPATAARQANSVR